MRTLLVNVLRWAVFAAHIGYAGAATLSVNKADPRCNDAAGTPFCSTSAAIDTAQVFRPCPRVRWHLP